MTALEMFLHGNRSLWEMICFNIFNMRSAVINDGKDSQKASSVLSEINETDFFEQV